VEIDFVNLLIVAVVAFAVPLLLGLFPKVRLPSVVLEIIAGILIGPAVLGWVEVDEPVEVLSLIGLAFLLFCAGLEIDFSKLRGRVLRIAVVGFGISILIGIAAGFALSTIDYVKQPLFLAIVLSATSLGIIVPVLKDAGEADKTFGQLVIAAATIADFATIILLSVFFSREATSTTTRLLLIGGLLLAVLLVLVVLLASEHLKRLQSTLRRLQDTTAQIRVRGAFLLMIGLTALATQLGLELILGAFLAGMVIALADRDSDHSHPLFRVKLDAIGFGVFIPVFFVATGVSYDLDALLDDSSILMRVPIFLLALLAVRGLPALLYRSLIGTRKTFVAALLQATSLPFIVAATAIGVDLEVITPANSAALIAAGLISVVLFPVLAVSIVRGAQDGRE